MVDIGVATEIAREKFLYKTGAFYGSHSGLDLGVGLIYNEIPYAIFDKAEKLFDTVSGLVYVLSHECDVDQNNPRFFNDYVLICPIIDYLEFVYEVASVYSDHEASQLATDLVSDRIFRAIYIPPISQTMLPHGGILYFNQIGNTAVSSFGEPEAQAVCALSSYAQAIIDRKLENHLLRPKAQALPRLR
jgi:hypothetical protein